VKETTYIKTGLTKSCKTSYLELQDSALKTYWRCRAQERGTRTYIPRPRWARPNDACFGLSTYKI